ncbi:MAG: NmrA family NAD(P)-binding protein, partial [Actinomyces sp.]
MRITVIGGSGATGSAVVAEAARRGHTVTSVTRSGMHAEGATADVVADLADTPAVVDQAERVVARRAAQAGDDEAQAAVAA